MLTWRSAEKLLADDDDGVAGAAFGGQLWASRSPKIFHRYRGSAPPLTEQFVLEPELPCECSICRQRHSEPRVVDCDVTAPQRGC
jgi:hypothetical protein